MNVNSMLNFITVSECGLTPTQQNNFQLNHGENKLIFNEMMMRSGLL